MPTSEPTLADVLARLDRIDERFDGLEKQVDRRFDETNLRIKDLNTEVVNTRADVATFRLDAITRLTTLFDSLAAFRTEYNTHWHPNGPDANA